MSKDYVKNNMTFSPEQILEFYELFSLYADYTTKRVDLRDILATAQTLDLGKKFKMVFRILSQIYEENKELAQQDENYAPFFDFETFILTLTQKMVLIGLRPLPGDRPARLAMHCSRYTARDVLIRDVLIRDILLAMDCSRWTDPRSPCAGMREDGPGCGNLGPGLL